MRYVHDSEFLDDGERIGLISIGIVAEDGREYYAISDRIITDPWLSDSVRRHDWLMANVVPYLPSDPDGHFLVDPTHADVKSRRTIALDVMTFLRHDDSPELWAWYAGCGYDHVALAQLWGPLSQRPEGVPMRTRDLVDLWEFAGRPPKPPEPARVHHPVEDAQWGMELLKTCLSLAG